MTTPCTTEHPIVTQQLDEEELRHRALLVALGLVYYMRLNNEYRKGFVQELNRINFAVDFLTAFTEEVIMANSKGS